MKKLLSCLSLVSMGFLHQQVLAQKPMLVAVEEYSAQLAMYDLTTNKKIGEVAVGFKPHEVAIDHKTRRCFVTNFGLEDYYNRDGVPGTTISVIDLNTFKEITRITTTQDSIHCKAPHGIKIRPNKNELYTNSEAEDTMLVYDLSTFALKRKFSIPHGTHNFRFTPTGDSLWVMAGKNGIYHLDPDNGKERTHIPTPTPIRGLVLHNGKIVASLINEVQIIDPYAVNKPLVFKELGVGQIIYSGITDDGRYVFAPNPNDSVVVMIDVKKGQPVQRFKTGHSPTNVVTYKNFAYVSNTEDEYISIIDIAKKKIIGTMPSHGPNGLEIIY